MAKKDNKDRKGLPAGCFADAASYASALDRHLAAKEQAGQAAKLERAAAELSKLQRYAAKDSAFATRNADRIGQLTAMLTPSEEASGQMNGRDVQERQPSA